MYIKIMFLFLIYILQNIDKSSNKVQNLKLLLPTFNKIKDSNLMHLRLWEERLHFDKIIYIYIYEEFNSGILF